MGYRVKAGLFTAAEVGAPHKRERLFILAYREGFFGERGFAERDLGWKPEVSLGGKRCDVADASRTRTGKHKLGSRGQSDRDQQDMADASRLLGKKIKRYEPNGTCGGMGNPDNTGLERRHGGGGCENQLPAWAPGPTEHEEWKRIPAHLKPAVCRVADGLAHRVDRLRLCGNGVVPLVAAYAFCTLATQAIKEHGSA
jgi:DNA (cytosine-5)-methyltransferase 1